MARSPLRTLFLRYAWSLLPLLGCAACEDTLQNVQLKEGRPLLVVDGQLTDRAAPDTLFLRTSAPYFANQPPIPATGARVTLRSGSNAASRLTEVKPGCFLLLPRAVVGQRYTLHITWYGEQFEGSTEVRRNPGITRLEVRHQQPAGLDEGHYVYYFGSDPPGLGDNYWVVYYRNGRPQLRPRDLRFFNDSRIDGNQLADIRLNEESFQSGDQVRVELHSITSDQFEFLTQVDNQINPNIVGFFGVPLANIVSNVRNLAPGGTRAVGYFGASLVTTREVIVP